MFMISSKGIKAFAYRLNFSKKKNNIKHYIYLRRLFVGNDINVIRWHVHNTVRYIFIIICRYIYNMSDV